MNLLRQLAVIHLREGLDVGVLMENGAIRKHIVLHHRRVVAQLLSVELQHDVVRVLATSRIDVLLLDSRNEIGALHFNADISRVVFLISIVSANEVSAYDVIQNLFPDKNKDFVFNITETEIVLVKEIKAGIDNKDLEKLARSISDTLSGEFFTKVNVGIGTPVTGIKDLARSFKEAQIAIEVGKVFDTDKTIVSYDNLGIARLIYHLPTTLCETFLKEVFKKGSIVA